MQRSIKRGIVKRRARTNRIGGYFGAWANYQRKVYGDFYDYIRNTGMRRRFHLHALRTFKPMNQRVLTPATPPIGPRMAIRNAFTNFFRKPSRREATTA